MLERLQAWFENQCNGGWEYTWGIKIETTDNPGWLITIDLTDTKLNGDQKLLREYSATDMDWLVCRINNRKQFVGAGDSTKLVAILTELERFTETCGKT
ncbi:MAG TPA: Imm53 family immunity protein [Bryobacteraceae bacterium]|nr:Imm53 family immunity protein [Bryobacteraceae bacterium]